MSELTSSEQSLTPTEPVEERIGHASDEFLRRVLDPRFFELLQQGKRGELPRVSAEEVAERLRRWHNGIVEPSASGHDHPSEFVLDIRRSGLGHVSRELRAIQPGDPQPTFPGGCSSREYERAEELVQRDGDDEHDQC